MRFLRRLVIGTFAVIVAAYPAVAIDPELSQHASNSPATSSKQLSPVTIDDKYFRSDIPAADSQGTLTLKGAVEFAAVHNREMQEGRLEVSRFKWDRLAVETNRLPN